MSNPNLPVRCGDCAYFVRDGKCKFFQTTEGQKKDRPFSHAPFWVWSDCYSDKEQVRADVVTACVTFTAKPVRKVMPIMRGTICSEIPFAMLVPHEAQALKNHGQSLDKLASRGGLSWSEAVAILLGVTYREAAALGDGGERFLINKVRDWIATTRGTP